MVSLKCRLHVQSRLTKLGLLYRFDEPGIIEIFGKLSDKERTNITNELIGSGLPLLSAAECELIQNTEKAIASLIVGSRANSEEEYAEYISSHTNTDYQYLSKLFYELRGVSISFYILQQRIERAKELLVYSDKTIQQIAKELNYSSTSRLSYHFKKLTGLTPTFFKNLRQKRKELSFLGNRYQSDINSTERNRDEALHQIHGKSSVQNRRKKRA